MVKPRQRRANYNGSKLSTNTKIRLNKYKTAAKLIKKNDIKTIYITRIKPNEILNKLYEIIFPSLNKQDENKIRGKTSKFYFAHFL